MYIRMYVCTYVRSMYVCTCACTCVFLNTFVIRSWDTNFAVIKSVWYSCETTDTEAHIAHSFRYLYLYVFTKNILHLLMHNCLYGKQHFNVVNILYFMVFDNGPWWATTCSTQRIDSYTLWSLVMVHDGPQHVARKG